MTYENFKKIMSDQSDMALATTVNNQPNVRIVNFYYDDEEEKLYFISFNNSQKLEEFNLNNRVAITTVPKGDGRYVRIQGEVKASLNTIESIKENYIAKHPSYDWIIAKFGSMLTLFEIDFSKAIVAMSNEDIQEIIK